MTKDWYAPSVSDGCSLPPRLQFQKGSRVLRVEKTTCLAN